MSYIGELTKAMSLLGEQEDTLFVGQGVSYSGQRMFETFAGVPDHKKIEMPVVENFQMGLCTGLSLMGFVPVSIFPRMDFLLLACDALVNHLDKLPMFGWKPKVIIRVAVGSSEPFNPGPQHCQDHSEAFASMLKTVKVRLLHDAGMIISQYQQALERPESTLLVEYASEYGK